ncbi:MAG: AAA family ATPase [Caldilinea sp. CFX5]|nr:AAA family ATPase [Caldilinea sp. CFX5]
MKKRVLYSEANYAAIVRDHGYFVDKTEYIAKLEQIRNPVFLRPRRFGKSTLCSLLRYYYDYNEAAHFAELFGHTWIGQHPTGQQNQYLILYLNFSKIATGPTIQEIDKSFRRQCNHILYNLRTQYAPLLDTMPAIELTAPVADNLSVVLSHIWQGNLPPVFVIIDEYDNFANQLVTANKDRLYQQLTDDDSFFKSFFKTLKEGRETGAIANVFITGVLPILIDELASGFNIATIITLDPEFEAMIGFTQREVDRLLDEVYADYALDPATRPEVDTVIKNHYNGYHFVDPQGAALYNSTILLYFLRHLTRHGQMPEYLTDLNLRTDLSWVRRLTSANAGDTEAFVTQLTTENRIPYDKNFLTSKFNTVQFFQPGFYPISFFYLGMLTQQDNFFLRLPNLNMRQIFIEYFNELHQIDVSTRYSELMQAFVNRPDLEMLFAGYWREYIGQFPEAIFSHVNENFYRSTFFELCSRYLSKWFTWNMERSYPSGKSDLEFVGKYHEKFAGLRWVIEFKYYSNSEFRKLETTIDAFQLRTEDTVQINGYVEGLRREYPEAQIAQFVIYCFGNQGYRVFAV